MFQTFLSLIVAVAFLAGVLGGVASVEAQSSPPSVTAQDARKKKDLEARVAALEDLLRHFTRVGNEVFITGANLHIVNGLEQTDCTDAQGEPIPDCPNSLGNLIVGYNEPRVGEENRRTGSHNVVVGREHNFSRFGGLVVGTHNEISGAFASVSVGINNIAAGDYSSVSGGADNQAIVSNSSISGGQSNTAGGYYSSVSGGEFNTAGDLFSSVCGGGFNKADERAASVSGGSGNVALGQYSSVSGGAGRIVLEDFDWAAGSLFEDQ